MRHRTALTAVALGAALAVTALGGCSSDSSGTTSDDAKADSTATPSASGGSSAPAASSSPPAKPARKVSGHLDYTGAATGGADFSGGVLCEVKNGKLIGVTTPDVLAKKQVFPSFIATTADSPTQVALFNTPDGTSYSGRVPKSQGVSAHKSGGTWTVTVDGLQIAKDYSGAGAVVTLKGSLTCTRVS
ncbi:hypothetical protein [Streptomyces sp. NPDC020983]|uniref:hypothetical protein n=1 Tax=Streptomyces sp. NPDC020983 TaxID=3365106 RepID=UPI0037ABD58F